MGTHRTTLRWASFALVSLAHCADRSTQGRDGTAAAFDAHHPDAVVFPDVSYADAPTRVALSPVWSAFGIRLTDTSGSDATRAREALERGRQDVLAAPASARTDPEGYARERYSAGPEAVGAGAYEREQAVFADALVFSTVYSVYAAGGRAALEAWRASPPASTAQLLHPGDGVDAGVATTVHARLPSALAASYVATSEDSAGELGAAVFFATALPVSLARSAARGWAGDRALLANPRLDRDSSAPAVPVALWWIVLAPGPASRTDAEAIEFADAASTVLTRRHGGYRPPAGVAMHIPGAVMARATGQGTVALVARAGRRVLVAEGLPVDRAAAVVRDFAVGPR